MKKKMIQREIKVGIVMGSDTDLPIMAASVRVLKSLGISHEVRIISAHRTPEEAGRYASGAWKRGLEVIICGAGGAAHLAGAIASKTSIPVLCVPMPTSNLGGVDSLYSIVQMPAGVPVATLAIGKPGAKNAALLAAQILSLKYPKIRKALEGQREKMKEDVKKKDRKLVKEGVESYLKLMEK